MKMKEDFNSVDELTKFEKLGVPSEIAKAIVAAIMRSRAGLATTADVKESANNVTTNVVAILKNYVTQVVGKSERRQNNSRAQSENNLRQEIRESRNTLIWMFGTLGALALAMMALQWRAMLQILQTLIGA